MLSLRFSKKAEKSIQSLIKYSPEIARIIAVQIEKLRNNPTPNNSTKLKGYNCFRCRVGSFRIIYEFDNQTLFITLIAKRDIVYHEVKKLYS